MFTITRLIKALLPLLPSQHERDEAYLADATDIYDLERRMHELDERGRTSGQALPLGLGLR